MAAEVFATAASALAVVELSAKIALLFTQYLKDVSNARADIGRLIREVTSLKDVAENVQQLLDGPRGTQLGTTGKLRPTLESSLSILEELQKKLSPRKTRTIIKRLGFHELKWPFKSKDVEKVAQDLARYTQAISLALQIDQATIVLNNDQKMVLARLPIVEGATFDSHAEEHNPRCLPKTRTDLLSEISEWAQDPDAKAIYWLNGMAGTGKSTVSRTLANTFSEKGILGASFFFKRGEGDRGNVSKFFSTVASQLVRRMPATAIHIQNAIDADPSIFGKALREQFEKLILSPLSNISVSQDQTLVIIIDALDECERENDVGLLIKLLSRSKMVTSPRLRIFLTSRPELPIRLGFKAVDGEYQDFVLHEIIEPIIEHDLAVFLQHELQRIQLVYNTSVLQEDRRLPADWPSPTDIQTLTKMAVPLFIFAATACRFIEDRKGGAPDVKLRKVLKHQTRSQESKLDATYLPVLNQLLVDLSEREKEDVVEQFRDIVGSIVILANPLSTTALARLLNIPLSDIDIGLDMLHSVLNVPSSRDVPIKIFHLSFRDFLLDPEKRGKNVFWIDEEAAHKRLAASCLDLMERLLREDICEVQAPGTIFSSISSEEINKKLPIEVQYACRFWLYHLQQAGACISDKDRVWKFLITHFLHWLEALSWMGRVSDSIQAIQMLQSLVQPGNSKEISAFIKDAFRFIRASKTSIQDAPLQLYSSALVFAPKKSIIRSIFHRDIAAWISLPPNVPDSWGRSLQTLEGHGGFVSSVVFSPDSTLIASASRDETVRLWAADTGHLLQTLAGHRGWVYSVAFSPDGRLVSSASSDETVRIWATDSGDLLQVLKGHNDPVQSVGFSPNGKLVISGSHDKTVRLWATDSGDQLRVLEGHDDWIKSVTFSPDGRLIASASSDETVRLWATDTGCLLQTLEGYGHPVDSVAFSPNGSLIATASLDTIRLCTTDTKLMWRFDCHGEDFTSAVFSTDGGVVAAASKNMTVRLWNTNTGHLLQTLVGHGAQVMSVAFSSDGQVLASASFDETVRLWATDFGDSLQVPGGHGDEVSTMAFMPKNRLIMPTSDNTVGALAAGGSDRVEMFRDHSNQVASVMFSPDGRLLVSTSDDNTVQLWATDAGNLLHVLKCHSDQISPVMFSSDSKFLITTGDDNTVRLWATDTGDLLRVFDGHLNWIYTLTFSPDCIFVAAASVDNTIRLWTTDTGDLRHVFEGHGSGVVSVSFSPDCRLVASTSKDKTVRLWAVDTGHLLQILEGHDGMVSSIAFSPDGRLIASASMDRTLRLWATHTGHLIRTLKGHGDWIYLVVFSPNGKLMATTSHDKTVRIWATDTSDLLQVINIGAVSWTLSFDASNKHILTEYGAIAIVPLPTSPAESGISKMTTTPAETAQDMLFSNNRVGYGVSKDRRWITLNDENILWLPVDCRPRTSAILGSTVAIGSSSGRVLLMRFNKRSGKDALIL